MRGIRRSPSDPGGSGRTSVLLHSPFMLTRLEKIPLPHRRLNSLEGERFWGISRAGGSPLLIATQSGRYRVDRPLLLFFGAFTAQPKRQANGLSFDLASVCMHAFRLRDWLMGCDIFFFPPADFICSRVYEAESSFRLPRCLALRSDLQNQTACSLPVRSQERRGSI